MEITIDLDDDDLSLLESYYCHRNGYIPMTFFLGRPGAANWEKIRQLESLFQKLCDAADYPKD